MDLSMICDTVNHALSVMKPHAFVFGKNAIDLVYRYLKNKNQRVLLVLLVLVLQDINICNLADDTTTFACDEKLESILSKSEGNLELAMFTH